MLMWAPISWWYTAGWLRLAQRLGKRLVRIAGDFSVPTLIRTLGAPWRRIITYPGNSLGERARAHLDNLVSRLVGFTVRILALLAAALIILANGLFGLIVLIFWPLLPFIGLGLIVWGLW